MALLVAQLPEAVLPKRWWPSASRAGGTGCKHQVPGASLALRKLGAANSFAWSGPKSQLVLALGCAENLFFTCPLSLCFLEGSVILPSGEAAGTETVWCLQFNSEIFIRAKPCNRSLHSPFWMQFLLRKKLQFVLSVLEMVWFPHTEGDRTSVQPTEREKGK